MTTPSHREIWQISGPIMLSLLAQNIVGVTDTAFLGRVGEVELGASAIGGVFYLILFMVGFGFTTGVQILIARRYGEKNYAEIGPIFDNSFYFIGIFSLLVTALVYFFGSLFLKIVLSSEPIFRASSLFLKYRVFGLFFATSALLFRSFYTGISFTKYLSISAGIMAVLNIVLDYLLIFGHGGFPKMGIQGAAISSSISEAFALLFFIWITSGNKHLKRYHLFRLVKPDLIIETGIAHGGSLIFSASMLALLDMCDASEAGTTLDPRISQRKVLGIDIDIRAPNRTAREAHPLAPRIQMIQGSSIEPEIIAQVHGIAANYSRVLVCLDSNHTHEHVLAELEAYAPLSSKDSYCVVFDTIVEDLPEDMFGDRPWGPGNNPKTAVHQYLQTHPEFLIDASIQQKLLITVAPDGFLKRVAH